MQVELDILEKNNARRYFIQIDLKNGPNQL